MEATRWEQRYVNFKKALNKLKEAVALIEIKKLSELEVEGLIQRFEYTYELAWKTLQDLLKSKGYEGINGPGPVLGLAFEVGLIDNAEGWRRLKKSRELTSHTYDSETAEQIAGAIAEEYLGLFLFLRERLEKEQGDGQANLFKE